MATLSEILSGVGATAKGAALDVARFLLPRNIETKLGIAESQQPALRAPLIDNPITKARALGASTQSIKSLQEEMIGNGTQSLGDSMKNEIREIVYANVKAGNFNKTSILNDVSGFINQKVNEKILSKIIKPPQKSYQGFIDNAKEDGQELISGIGALLGLGALRAVKTVRHPIQTFKSDYDFVNQMATSPEYRSKFVQTYINPVIEEYKEFRHPWEKLYNDPLDVFLTATSLFSFAGGLAKTAGGVALKTGMAGTAAKLATTAKVLDAAATPLRVSNISKLTRQVLNNVPGGTNVLNYVDSAAKARGILGDANLTFAAARNRLVKDIDTTISKLTPEEVSALPLAVEGFTAMPVDASENFIKAMTLIKAMANDQAEFGMKVGKLTPEQILRRTYQPLANFLKAEGKIKQPLNAAPYENLTGEQLNNYIDKIKNFFPNSEPLYMRHFFEDNPSKFASWYLNTKPVRATTPGFIKKSYGVDGYIGQGGKIEMQMLKDVLVKQGVENLKWQKNIELLEKFKSLPETKPFKIGDQLLPGYAIFAPEGMIKFYRGTMNLTDKLMQQVEYTKKTGLEKGMTQTGFVIKEAEKLGIPVKANYRLRRALGTMLPIRGEVGKVNLKSFAPNTAIHEVTGHVYDWVMGGKMQMYSTRLLDDATLREQATRVISYTRPDMKGTSWFNKRAEKFAESVKLYVTMPAKLRQLAPDLYAEIDNIFKKHPDISGNVTKLKKLIEKTKNIKSPYKPLRTAAGAIGENAEDLFRRAVETAFPEKNFIGVTRAKLYQVPEGMASQLNSMVKSTHPFIKLFWDKPLDAFRFATLSMMPRWNINNAVGNMIFSIISGDIFNPKAFYYYRQAGKEGLLPDELFAGIHRTERTTSGALDQRALEHPVVQSTVAMYDAVTNTKVVGSIVKNIAKSIKYGIYKPVEKLGDTLFRLNDWVDDTFKGVAYINRALKEERQGFIRRMIGSWQEAEQILIKTRLDDVLKKKLVDDVHRWYYYGLNLTDFERRIVRRIMPFYSWMRWITQYSYTVATEAPVRANIIHNFARDFYMLTGQNKLPPELKGAVPIGNDEDGTVYYLKTSGANPFSTINDLMSDGIVTTAARSSAPGVKALMEYGFGRDFYFGIPFTKELINEYRNPNTNKLYKFDPELQDMVEVKGATKPALLELLLRNYIPQYLLMETVLTGGNKRYTAEGLDVILEDLIKKPEERKAVIKDIISKQPKQTKLPWLEFAKSLGINIKDVTLEDRQMTRQAIQQATTAIKNKVLPIFNPDFKNLVKQRVMQEIANGTPKEQISEKIKAWIGINVEQLKKLK